MYVFEFLNFSEEKKGAGFLVPELHLEYYLVLFQEKRHRMATRFACLLLLDKSRIYSLRMPRVIKDVIRL
jgi:hypothetical protein